MSVEKNKATIRRVVEEVFNRGNVSIIPELIDPEYVYRSTFGEYKGPEGFKRLVLEERAAIPDEHMQIDEMIGEGDRLAVRLSWTGTFTGKWGPLEPTGRKINMTAAFFYRFRDGKEVEAIPFANMLVFFQQLGIPVPQA
jgi:predicted ester cyclase